VEEETGRVRFGGGQGAACIVGSLSSSQSLANVTTRMPLYHFATTDLPADTIAPEMDDTNAAAALRADKIFTGEDLSTGGFVDEAVMGRYLSYLAGIGFLSLPEGEGGKKLPQANISPEQKIALLRVGGRGALV
jgi:L-aminoadipate-semialdehyde dehydrogenase